MEFKDARRITGLSQQKITDLYGIPKRTLQDWEGGKRKCPDWCKSLVIEKILNYKGDNNITFYNVVVTKTNGSISDEFNKYQGFEYDEAVKAYDDLIDDFNSLSEHDKKRTAVEARVYRIPADIDVADDDEVTNAMCECDGYDLLF